ncbi:MAG: SPOR domain-containing protein [Bacteroidetes bacterium]|nr:MAG: SPOR domain-containing protein [Bacteroidota bacterium]
MNHQIEKYISELLIEHECVVVPSFGAFVLNYRSAEIDSKRGKITPPRAVVTFNKKIVTNDGLLIKHVSDKEKISYQKAVQEVESFANHVKSLLKKNGNAPTLLGNFTLENNIWKFEGSSLPHPDFFGLEEFIFPKLPSQTPVLPIASEKASYRKYLKYAAVFTGVVLLSVSFLLLKDRLPSEYAGITLFSKKASKVYQPFSHNIPEFSLKTDRQDESLPVMTDNMLQIEEKRFIINNPNHTKVILKRKNRSVKRYHIIAGCFQYEENALQLVEKLHQKGFKAGIIDKKNGLYRVALESFSSRKEAKWFLKEIKRKENPSAWLLVR